MVKNKQQHFASSTKTTRVTPARRLAWDVLWCIHEQGCYLSEALDQLHLPDDIPAEEAAFMRLLATEVVARQGSLDILINDVLRNPEDIHDNVRIALRLSFCELFYLDKAPHAVVDQGVELVRHVAPKATRVANFALRRAVERKDAFPFADTLPEHDAKALQHGFPFWLEQRIAQEYGQAATERFMQRANEPAPLFFMVNTACANGPETLRTLVEAGCKIRPCSALSVGANKSVTFPTFVFLQRSDVAHPVVARLLKAGALVISDQAAQTVAALAIPQREPQSMLEIGAGRGTKTILLQNVALARFGHQITLDTLDISKQRSVEREQRLRRARIKQRTSLIQDATNLSALNSESYDAVFVDAPCTGVGTVRRHPDIRWRVNPIDITTLANTGARILAQAARLVKPGGQLVYATCTIFAEENEQVIAEFLASEVGRHFTCCDVRSDVVSEAGRRFSSGDVQPDLASETGCHVGNSGNACSGASACGALLPGTLAPQEHGPCSDSHFVCVLRR